MFTKGTYTDAGKPIFILWRPLKRAAFFSWGDSLRIISTERSVKDLMKVGVLKKAAICWELLLFLAKDCLWFVSISCEKVVRSLAGSLLSSWSYRL